MTFFTHSFSFTTFLPCLLLTLMVPTFATPVIHSNDTSIISRNSFTHQSTFSINAVYSRLTASYTKENFFDGFNFYDGPDPTRTFVKYVSRSEAKSSNLTATTRSGVYIGVDNKNSAPNGRSSVRLESKQQFNHGLFILDVEHMPAGCGTWPAFWTYGNNWPQSGEIDIIEGVNEQTYNSFALHTSQTCWADTSSNQEGKHITRNCDVNAANQFQNQGCQTIDTRGNTYGSGFNAAGGGVYAMEWDHNGVRVWFFPRNSIPKDALVGNPEPLRWPKPAAVFGGNGCDWDGRFKNNKIVINTAFCGDWGRNDWPGSSCANRARTCEDFVRDNPSAFKEAYWNIKSLKVWDY